NESMVGRHGVHPAAGDCAEDGGHVIGALPQVKIARDRSATSNCRSDDSRIDKIRRRAGNDIRSAIRVRLEPESARTASPHFHRLIVHATDKLSASDVVSAKLPKSARAVPAQSESIDVAQSSSISEEGAGQVHAGWSVGDRTG